MIFTKKRLIWSGVGLALILLIGWRAMSKPEAKYVDAYTISKADVRQTVLATGTVTSQSDLNLSFKSSGTLSRLNVKVGDKVRKGQVLAMLDQKDAAAAISQANASLLAAQANYEKVVNGASSAEVQVAKAAVAAAQVALDNAKAAYENTIAQQKITVANALAAMNNAGLSAQAGAGNASTATATLSGTYTGTEQGQYKISLVNTGNGLYVSYSGLENGNTPLSRGVPAPVGTKGLYFTLGSSGTVYSSDYWTVDIPNTQSSTYLTAYNSYQSALQTQTQTVTSAKGAVDTAQAALDQQQAQLALKISAARPEDIKAAQAQVATASAQLQAAQNQYSNNVITSPIDGTVISVDLKLGETVAPQKTAIVVLDQSDLHVESNISESSISLVKTGQVVDMTLDAFGPDRHFSGEVLSIDPASTVVSGVINYRVVSSLPQDVQDIKPGMTANLTILITEKKDVLSIPNRLIKTVDNKKTVLIKRDGKPVEVEITTGLSGDSMTEVISGLQNDEIIVTEEKKK